eukprot:365256-Chlamydomonas_euryale.AAC.3
MLVRINRFIRPLTLLPATLMETSKLGSAVAQTIAAWARRPGTTTRTDRTEGMRNERAGARG